ncbi:MAG: adenosylcobinamide-GDP ribazoletransferase [Cognatishimia sp.]|uniref:adenosylcobinamide-GDP ribazoletransferase n=1 Tax=Cognatishimia sp. TaxID=2211648 RepID=UPI003B8C9966
MQKDDMSLVTLGDIRTSIALLTRIPVKAEFDRVSRAAWAYPLAGLAVAMIASVVTFLLLWMGIAPAIAAGFWITSTIVLTGAMHEDGLADCADGFWGGFDKSRRLEIMKDSQIGSYGVIALVLSIGIRWFAVTLLIQTGDWFWVLFALEVLSRSAMPAIMHSLPHARDTGLSHAQGRPPMQTVALAAGMGFAISFVCLGWVAFQLIVLLGVVTFAMGVLSQRKIDGQTGDVLGATQQITLLTALIILA